MSYSSNSGEQVKRFQEIFFLSSNAIYYIKPETDLKISFCLLKPGRPVGYKPIYTRTIGSSKQDKEAQDGPKSFT